MVYKRWRTMTTVLVFMGIAVLFLAGCDGFMGGSKSDIKFDTEYQAVFMDNGQVFFGKVENAGSPYPILRNVYYIRQQVNPDTKAVANILVKRGSEWHGADRMYINNSHIAIIEPVAPSSQVAKMIKDAEAQKPPEAPKPAEPPKPAEAQKQAPPKK